MKRQRLLFLLLACALFLSACARPFILEDLGMILTVGYDLSEDGELLMTVSMPQVTGDSKHKVKVVTSKGDLVKEARENISRATDRQVVSGQMRTAIFSEKLARQGVWTTFDTLLRDVNITKSLIVCVSDGPAREMLSQDLPIRPSSGRYLFEMFRKESRNFTVPRSTIFDFVRDYYDIGTDPVTPYVRLAEEGIQAAGTAMFRDDVFVGSLSPEETKMLLLLKGSQGEGGDIKQALKNVRGTKLPPQVMLSFVRTDHEVTVGKLKDGTPHVLYDVNVKGQVIEHSGGTPLSDPKNLALMQQMLSKGLERRMLDLLNQLQHKYKCDPLGVGSHLRATGQYEPWSKEKWRSLYGRTKVEVKFRLGIERIGLIK